MAAEQNPQNFQIIPADWRDLKDIRQIESECFPLDAWPLLDMIAMLTFKNIVRLKALVQDRTVGFVAGELRQGRTVGWIATLGVLHEYRRKGIAAALLKECENRLAVNCFRLSVRKSNLSAIQLYRDSGYRYIGQWDKYYKDGSDAIVYEKRRSYPL